MPVSLTDAEIQRFVNEPKLLEPNYRERIRLKPKRGHKEAELDFEGADGTPFCLILRQSMNNPFDFSVILGYRIPKTNILFRLCRYNGKHGEHTNKLEGNTFDGFHIHKATRRYQELGWKEDAYAEPTDRYASFHEALQCMLANCGFELPPNPQPSLPLFSPQGGI